MRSLPVFFGLFLSITCGMSLAAGNGKPVYRWLDASGQVHFGDKIPPQDAKQGREQVNARGMVTKVVAREASPAEQAAAEARTKSEHAAAEAHEHQLAYDRNLLLTYTSVAEIQARRLDRLAILDGRVTQAESAVKDTEKTLADLRARVTPAKPVPALSRNIETFELSLVDGLRSLHSLQAERASTEAGFAGDIERYKKLKSGALQPGG